MTRMGYEQMLDGVKSLENILVRAGYRTVLDAVAEHTVFLHPETVAQTDGEALFAVARTKDMVRRGCIVERSDGGRVMLDDNTSLTVAFEWSAQQQRGPDVQFNHLYKGTKESGIYTALWNICVTPAFLAKLTDVKHHGHVVAAQAQIIRPLAATCPTANRSRSHPTATPAWHGVTVHRLCHETVRLVAHHLSGLRPATASSWGPQRLSACWVRWLALLGKGTNRGLHYLKRHFSWSAMARYLTRVKRNLRAPMGGAVR